MRQTLEQKRAADSLAKINKFREDFEQEERRQKEYVSYVKSLPATILVNGLGQAAASLLAANKGKLGEKKTAHYILYKHLQDWLCRDSKQAPYQHGNLMQAITTNDRESYMHAQAEALAWLQWQKKFAVAYLKSD